MLLLLLIYRMQVACIDIPRSSEICVMVVGVYVCDCLVRDNGL